MVNHDFDESDAASTESRERVIPHPPPRSAARAIPAILLMFVAIALLAYRLGVSDWHWRWPWEARPTSPAIAATGPDVAPSVMPKAIAAPERRVQERAPNPAIQQQEANPAPEHLAAAEQPPAESPDALAEIQKEAERIRKEREALANHKEREGERLANAPRPPALIPRGAINPALIARQQAEMMRLMREMAEAAHEGRIDAMSRVQRELLARNGVQGNFPGWIGRGNDFAALDEAMNRMLERFDAMEREINAAARGARLPERAVPPWAVPPPPMPGLPPEIGDDGPIDLAPRDDNARGNPKVRRFDVVDRNGNRMQGVEVQWGLAR